ncbi:Glutathione S-transferase, C-terminal domain [Oligella ureolytica]|uniref:Glutathione S-transferase family protein n=1 Tax=Oligella ureolytica TaxID=90244 RepID=A0A378XGP6_9BURK|nr:glutathione S-transferase family protein [Oligella ureolytica]QPT39578.1 glutathione S-transferase family protein [Oligella ureolytica]SUA56761.1 Glutathione S-transferase, C-terminal domain [Oligella ureolytica]
MGILVDGVWQEDNLIKNKEDGKFIRPDSAFRDWITTDGSPGPEGQKASPAEKGRYHLYVSLACPWAHRTLITRVLKGLEDMISVSVVHWHMGAQSWNFEDAPGVVADPVMNAQFLHQIYTLAKPGMSGKVTVPVLFDKKERTIINNESSEIIRIFNEAFDDLGALPGHYYPAPLRGEIDEINERIYHTLNNGVYKCGFATTQEAYEEAYVPLFETLDFLEEELSQSDYLVGNQLTEADIRLFPTLIRFDSVYYSHFKCNKKRIQDYPNLHRFVERFMSNQKIAATVNFHHIKHHYYGSHKQINPSGIVPHGPDVMY